MKLMREGLSNGGGGAMNLIGGGYEMDGGGLRN